MGAERSSPPDFEAIERQQNIDNLAAMAGEITGRSQRLQTRIAHFATQFGLPETRFWRALEADPAGPLAAVLAREARRQNVHEGTAAEYVAGLVHVEHFERLPSTGPRAKYVDRSGFVITGARLEELLNRRPRSADKPSKSIDFEWRTGPVTCYAAQKYTKEEGGNQDSQFIEVQQLVQNFQQRTTNDSALLILVDGPYYHEERLSALKASTRTQSPRSYVTGAGGLPRILAEIVAVHS